MTAYLVVVVGLGLGGRVIYIFVSFNVVTLSSLRGARRGREHLAPFEGADEEAHIIDMYRAVSIPYGTIDGST